MNRKWEQGQYQLDQRKTDNWGIRKVVDEATKQALAECRLKPVNPEKSAMGMLRQEATNRHGKPGSATTIPNIMQGN